MNKYENYGDVNPTEQGGIWVKKEGKSEFSIIKNDPERMEYYILEVNITDDWIEREKVKNFIGMKDNEFDEVWFAIGCTDYYNYLNFGEKYEYRDEEELKEILEKMGLPF